MPSGRVHRRVAEEWLGTSDPNLHFILDHPSQGEMKGGHEMLFHDWDMVKYIEKKLGPNAAREAFLHICMDIEKWRKVENKRIKI